MREKKAVTSITKICIQLIMAKKSSQKVSTHRILLSLVYFVSIAEPVATFPQIYTIWVNKQTAGVSLLSWCGFLVAAIIWLLYGISRKDKALIVSGFAWVIAEGLVILGLLLYH